MSGVFSPVVWSDGDDSDNIPNADDLNAEWRDTLNFFMGYDGSTGTSRPMIACTSTTATSLAVANTEYNVPFNNERIKRGAITHSTSTNNHQITVPITGQYQGYVHTGVGSTSTVTTKLITRIRKTPATPVIIARFDDVPQRTTGWSMAGALTLDLTAGDTIWVTVATTAGTGALETGLFFNSKIGLWYAGDNS